MNIPLYFCTDLKDERLNYFGANSFMVATVNGIEIYQLDDILVAPHRSWWINLQSWLYNDETLHLESLALRFRSNLIKVPDSVVYYYSRGALQSMHDTETQYCHVIGWLNSDGLMECHWYKSPELIECKPPKAKQISECQDINLLWVIKELKKAPTPLDMEAAS